MKTVVYVPDSPPEKYSKSIFLAGPSPRDKDQPNWRLEALEILDRLGYNGVVFVPLPKDTNWSHSYESQVSWEQTNLDRADQIVFWVPRDMKTLPALTTNVEFGKYFNSGRTVLGYPLEAPNMRYLDALGTTEAVPTFHTLEETLLAAMSYLGNGAEREGGERDVPLNIWKLNHFQQWYQSQKASGNRLEGAKVLWVFRVGHNKSFTFSFVLRVNVHIASENRNKTNEFIFSRPDIATIIAYSRPTPSREELLTEDRFLMFTEVALIREFRSPARTEDSFIHEVPGGSSWKPNTDPLITMSHELEEETGLSGISPKRLRLVGSRQLCGTLSTHQAHVFSCELSAPEMDFLKLQQMSGAVHGVEKDTERTYVEIYKLYELLRSDSNLVDWSMLGMILTALSLA
jgi:hypothetical protein